MIFGFICSLFGSLFYEVFSVTRLYSVEAVPCKLENKILLIEGIKDTDIEVIENVITVQYSRKIPFHVSLRIVEQFLVLN
jgi:hypothetical protein